MPQPTPPPSDPFRDQEQQARRREREQQSYELLRRQRGDALYTESLVASLALLGLPALLLLMASSYELAGALVNFLALPLALVTPFALLLYGRRARRRARTLGLPLDRWRTPRILTIVGFVLWIPAWLACGFFALLALVGPNAFPRG